MDKEERIKTQIDCGYCKYEREPDTLHYDETACKLRERKPKENLAPTCIRFKHHEYDKG